MRNIYTCIDLGSYEIKIVTLERIEDKYVVLSRIKERSKGIKKGIIVDEEEAFYSVQKAILKSEKEIGLKIKKVLCLLPGYSTIFKVEDATIDVEDGQVGKDDIMKILQEVVNGKVDSNNILVNIEPIVYKVDDRIVIDPLDEIGNTLSLKAVVSQTEKKVTDGYFSLFKKLNIEIVDIAFSIIGDYFEIKDEEKDKSTVAVIDIGHDKTELGIFNKGALIKTDVIPIGSKNVDKDIAYMYRLDRKKAHYLKENFACSNTRYSDACEVIDIQNKNDDTIRISQLEISEVVEARLIEILKQAKKQINILTNKEIRYIIVTGGISELVGFQYILDNIFGRCASIMSMNEIGIRDNSYSTVAGFIKYFDKKLESRGKLYTMYSMEEINKVTKIEKTTSESGLGGILNYFTGNKED